MFHLGRTRQVRCDPANNAGTPPRRARRQSGRDRRAGRPDDTTAEEEAPDTVASPSGEEEEPGVSESGHNEDEPSRDAGRRGRRSRSPAATAGIAALVLGALGVVYGDIGTSPLYAVQTVFSIDGGRIGPTTGDVLGVISIVVWSLIVIVSVKYVTVVLRADNNGEGGVLALAALVRQNPWGPGPGRQELSPSSAWSGPVCSTATR